MPVKELDQVDLIECTRLIKIGELFKNKFFLYLLVSIFFGIFMFLSTFHYYSYATLCLYLVFGIILYISIIYSEVEKLTLLTFDKNGQSTWIYFYLSAFFISFSSSIFYLRFFEDLYHKSLSYYLLIGICSSCIFLILMSYQKRFFEYVVPILIVFLALNIFLSNLIVFPNGVYASGDTHYQIYHLLLPILQNAQIPLNEGYSFFPLHQIFVASMSLISGADPIFTYKFAPGFIYAVSSLFIYSLGKKLIGSRFGIISMLLYILSPEIVYHATHAYQFSYALIIGILFLYILESLILPANTIMNNQPSHQKMSWIILHILILIAIIWTHQFTSMVIFVMTILLLIVALFIFEIDSKNIYFYLDIFLLFLIMLFAHWMYVSNVFPSLMRITDLYYVSLFSPENYQASISTQIINSVAQSFWIDFLNTSGKGLLFLMASVGSLYGLSKKNSYTFLWLVWCIFIFSLVAFGSFIDMPLLLPGRMLSFFWAISVVYLSGLGVLFLAKKFKGNCLIFCCLLLFITTILTLGSTSSGTESSLFKNEESIHLYDTNSDLQYYSWIQTKVPENLHIMVSKSWVLQNYDKMRIYSELPTNSQYNIEITELKINEYIIFNIDDTTALRIRGTSEQERISSSTASTNMTTVDAKNAQLIYKNIDIFEFNKMVSKLNCIYSNSKTSICIKA
ncbi:hypothetical protein MSLAZ_3001 [Methanosarcina lacustris Z-7289]|uniref:Glycosyltransferase RgtA/B/C/D-like domain-containing protein n=1 Tax=Methanosarcina lacustris Z-7289 TaxID=1434111 RepID=A0A0E3S9H6_9EURY|nr:hypothetical protein [Methanosarcina lacustris]AKB76262.1 hypothetical protein MSLAZ_3001 [Methanosarcina lacustris Z-7289]